MKTLWKCNNYDCRYEYLGEDFVDTPDTDCPMCGYHDSVGIAEEFEDSTLKEFLERSDNSDYAKLPKFDAVYKRAYELDGDKITVATFYECLKELGNFT